MTTTTVTLNAIECADCGLVFGITERFEQNRRRRHDTFYCPLGHPNHYPQKTEEEKQRERAGRLAAQLDQERAHAADLQRSLSAQKAATTRAKRRHAAGVCPCCNRTFQQLARHLQTKHPDYDAASA